MGSSSSKSAARSPPSTAVVRPRRTPTAANSLVTVCGRWFSIDGSTGCAVSYPTSTSEALEAALRDAAPSTVSFTPETAEGAAASRTYTIDPGRGVQARGAEALGGRSVFRETRTFHAADSLESAPWVAVSVDGRVTVLRTDNAKTLERDYRDGDEWAMFVGCRMTFHTGRVSRLQLPPEIARLAHIAVALERAVRAADGHDEPALVARGQCIVLRMPRPSEQCVVWTAKKAGSNRQPTPLSLHTCLALETATRGSITTVCEVGCGWLDIEVGADKAVGTAKVKGSGTVLDVRRHATLPAASFQALWYVLVLTRSADEKKGGHDCEARVLDRSVAAWLEHHYLSNAQHGCWMYFDSAPYKVDFRSMKARRARCLFGSALDLRRVAPGAAFVTGRDTNDELRAAAARDSSSEDDDADEVTPADDELLSNGFDYVFASHDPRRGDTVVPYSLRNQFRFRRAFADGRKQLIVRFDHKAVLVDLENMRQESIAGVRKVCRVPVTMTTWLPWRVPQRHQPEESAGAAIATWGAINPLTKIFIPYLPDKNALIEAAWQRGDDMIPVGGGSQIHFGTMMEASGAGSVDRSTYCAVRRFEGYAVLPPSRAQRVCVDDCGMTYFPKVPAAFAGSVCGACKKAVPAGAPAFTCACKHVRCGAEDCAKAPCTVTAERTRALTDSVRVQTICGPTVDVDRTVAAVSDACTSRVAAVTTRVRTAASALQADGRVALAGRLAKLSLSISPEQVESLLARSPIIIHVKLHRVDIAERVLSDTHLRNQFETAVTGGHFDPTPSGLRAKWEDVQFLQAYQGAPGFARPKYGVVNFTRDVRGVYNCRQYGSCWLQLKPHVSLRSTITACDSGCMKPVPIGTLDALTTVAAALTDAELNAVAEMLAPAVEKRKPWVDSKVVREYKEAQIHGEVRFDRDVEAIGVSPRAARKPFVMTMINRFCAANGVRRIMIPATPDPAVDYLRADVEQSTFVMAPAVSTSAAS